jgi:hypothetical protein
MREVRDTLLRCGGRKSIIFLGSLASPSRPSDKDSMKVMTLDWLKIVD